MYQSSEILLLVRGLLLRLSLSEPSKERLSGLADLLGGGKVGILLASLGSPLGYDVLADEIVVVVQLEDLDNRLVHFRMLVAQSPNKAFRTAKQSLLVALRADDLDKN